MTQTLRYQEGSLTKKHGAWYARYYEHVKQKEGSIKLVQRWKKIASLKDYPNKSEVKPRFAKFMQALNSVGYTPGANTTIGEFVETIYRIWLPSNGLGRTRV